MKTVKKMKKEKDWSDLHAYPGDENVTKIEDDFIVEGSHVEVWIRVNKYALSFLKWFHNAFKAQYPHVYDNDFEINQPAPEENDQSIRILAWNRAISPEALLCMYNDYVLQENTTQEHIKHNRC